ncbi:uncharacterized protein JCM10292_006964 [Rhodotorula paludigena]|uniref:uncharacterized protein n=1 Tax=Rhodotorula paludigena TaxID=86838 RepID=UPI003173AB97
MSDKVQLRSADSPPVVLEVSRAALVVGSRVFADLLSLPAPDKTADAVLDLHETEKDIKPFLQLLEGDDQGTATLLTTDTQIAAWETLARLVDKFDSPVGRLALRGKIYERLYRNQSPTLAFLLATVVNDRNLLFDTGLKIIHLPDLDKVVKVRNDWHQKLAAQLDIGPI